MTIRTLRRLSRQPHQKLGTFMLCTILLFVLVSMLNMTDGQLAAGEATAPPLRYGQQTTAQVIFCLDRGWALFYAHQEEASIRLEEDWDRFQERLRPFYASGRCQVNPDGPWMTFITTETVYRWQARVYGSDRHVPYAIIRAVAEVPLPGSRDASTVRRGTVIYVFMEGDFPPPGHETML